MNTLVKSLVIAGAVIATTIAVAPGAGATDNSYSCVDGKKRSNLVVTWKSNDNVTVGTVNNRPLCNDVNLNFSSYVMPDNYNGKSFTNNPTATPQTILDNATATLKKGSKTPVKLSIKLPEACKNMQVDVYYAPKIETVMKSGHGAQYISGKIIKKTVDSCAPVTPETPQTPETPVTPVTPVVPTPEAQEPETPAPVVVIPTMPAELPATGNEAATAAALATVLSAATYGATYLILKRR